MYVSVRLAIAAVCLSVVAAFLPFPVWASLLVVNGVLAVLVAIDVRSAPDASALRVRRDVPAVSSSVRTDDVRVELFNSLARPVEVALRDAVPASLRRTPGTAPAALEKVQQAAEALQSADKPVAPKGVLRVQVEEGFRPSSFVWSSSVNLMSAVNQVVMVVFLTYFMLLSDQLFKRKLVEIVGTVSQKKTTVLVLEDIAGQIERFIKIQLFTSTAVALITWAALWSLGLEQAALWGLLAGVFNSIPYYGPLIVTGALSIVAYLQFGTVSMTAAVAGVSLLVTTLEGFLLTPFLIGRASSMNQVAVFGGLLFWSWVWGVWGILLAVPMMMVIKVVCDHVEPLQPVGHLLGD